MTLFCEQLPYTHLAEEFGTPLYVYSKSALTEAFENYQTAVAIRFDRIADKRI